MALSCAAAATSPWSKSILMVAGPLGLPCPAAISKSPGLDACSEDTMPEWFGVTSVIALSEEDV